MPHRWLRRIIRLRVPPQLPPGGNGEAAEEALRAARQRLRDTQRSTAETDRFAAEIERTFRLRGAGG